MWVVTSIIGKRRGRQGHLVNKRSFARSLVHTQAEHGLMAHFHTGDRSFHTLKGAYFLCEVENSRPR